MPINRQTVIHAVTFTTNVAITTTTEKVVVTLPGIDTGGADASVWLHGWVQVTSGTGTTGLTATIEQGAAAGGTIVGEGNEQTMITAGDTVDITVDAIDLPGEVASQSYVLTVTQAGATGNGTALQGGLLAIVTG